MWTALAGYRQTMTESTYARTGAGLLKRLYEVYGQR
jgi:hypothetical protein